jgi:DNA-binding NarL/FixJ family response regulator
MGKAHYDKILIMLSNGKKVSEIGQSLELSPRTIEKQIELLKSTYGAKNVTHLIAIVLREKIIE